MLMQKQGCCSGCSAQPSKKLTAEEMEMINKRIAEGGSATLTAAEVKEKIAQGGGYLRGFKPPLDYDYDNDSDDEILPYGALLEHRRLFYPVWSCYYKQTQQTNGFELYDHPGESLEANLVPLDMSKLEKPEVELLKRLANRAIHEYNEKECNVYKYEFLTIEKVNFQQSAYAEYFMTVKVKNQTLGTPIESFQVHAAKRMGGGLEEIIFYRPKVQLNPNEVVDAVETCVAAGE